MRPRWVNGNRNLISCRQLKTDKLGFIGRRPWCGDAAEVSVFDAVADSFECDDFGVVDEAVDHGGEALTGQFGSDVHFVAIDARNVGAARAAGFSYAHTLCEEAARDD
jgi:hypothetical protein